MPFSRSSVGLTEGGQGHTDRVAHPGNLWSRHRPVTWVGAQALQKSREPKFASIGPNVGDSQPKLADIGRKLLSTSVEFDRCRPNSATTAWPDADRLEAELVRLRPANLGAILAKLDPARPANRYTRRNSLLSNIEWIATKVRLPPAKNTYA